MNGLQQKFLAFRVYRHRDTDAYRDLYREYAPAIQRFLALKLPRQEDAEELTTEVFLRAWEYMTANLVEQPRALFYRLASNLTADFYRSAKATEPLDDELAATLAAKDDVGRAAELREAMDELYQKLDAIKPEYRDALIMRYVDELSVEEIATVLGKSANTIRVLLFRARQALKKV